MVRNIYCVQWGCAYEGIYDFALFSSEPKAIEFLLKREANIRVGSSEFVEIEVKELNE